ncbi:MAG TPA: carbohydrate ABC transporter permease [Spirochaetia bacterium]|nr:carbohydrate ABC transporter permease [Spirochaetia bacterium]
MKRSEFSQVVLTVCLGLVLLLALLPLVLMVVISLKDPLQYQSDPTGLTFPWDFGNYSRAIAFLAPHFLWTFVVIAVGIVSNLVTSSWAAYVLARYRFVGKSLAYWAITGLMFVPTILVLYPLYLWNIQLGLRDLVGLTVSYWVLGHCYSVFLLQNAFRGLSEEYFEAARMDGAGHLTIWWKIVVPLGRTMITTLAIMMLIWIYTNDYVWQYIMSGAAKLQMIPVVVRGLGQSGSGGSDLDHGLEAAGYVVASAPMLVAFALASKAFVRGLTSGGTKG